MVIRNEFATSGIRQNRRTRQPKTQCQVNRTNVILRQQLIHQKAAGRRHKTGQQPMFAYTERHRETGEIRVTDEITMQELRLHSLP